MSVEAFISRFQHIFFWEYKLLLFSKKIAFCNVWKTMFIDKQEMCSAVPEAEDQKSDVNF